MAGKLDRYPFQNPVVGDICVRPRTGPDNVYIIERRAAPEDARPWKWEQVATEKAIAQPSSSRTGVPEKPAHKPGCTTSRISTRSSKPASGGGSPTNHEPHGRSRCLPRDHFPQW